MDFIFGRKRLYNSVFDWGYFNYQFWQFRQEFIEYTAEMYNESDFLKEHFSDWSNPDMANFVWTKREEALNLSYANEYSGILRGLNKSITIVNSLLILTLVAFISIVYGSEYIFELPRIVTVISVFAAFINIILICWIWSINYDQTAHNEFNENFVSSPKIIALNQRDKDRLFGAAYWNAILKQKKATVGILCLFILHQIYMKVLREWGPDPLYAILVAAGQNWEEIMEQEGVFSRTNKLWQLSNVP